MAELAVLKFDVTEDGVEQAIGNSLSEMLGKGFVPINTVGAGNYVIYVLLNQGTLVSGIRPTNGAGPLRL